MKFRSDFVTNSSSSSYILLHAIGKDGTDYDLLPGGKELWDDKHFPEIRDGKLVFSARNENTPPSCTVEITSPKELAAVLLFGCSEQNYCHGEMDTKVYQLFHEPCAMFPLFEYLCGNLTPSQLMEQLQDVMELEPFRTLKAQKDDKSFELAFLSILNEQMGIPLERKRFIDRYVSLAKNAETLADISKLELIDVTERWQGGLDEEYERFQKVQKEEQFSAVSENDPGYQQAYTKWINILKDRILSQDKRLEYDPDPDTLVRNALASGNIQDLFPRGYHVTSKVVCDLSGLDEKAEQ